MKLLKRCLFLLLLLAYASQASVFALSGCQHNNMHASIDQVVQVHEHHASQVEQPTMSCCMKADYQCQQYSCSPLPAVFPLLTLIESSPADSAVIDCRSHCLGAFTSPLFRPPRSA